MATKKAALGTGLGALFGDESFDITENILGKNTGELSTLSITKVEPRKDQPRQYFNEEALNTLAESISQYGLIQPIVVRKINDDYYQIIAGERRWRASKIAGLEEVPVRIIEADDRTTAELALVENLQREDLNPIEEAKGYRSLMDEYGLTQDETSKSVGRSRSAIANSLRLLNLVPEVLSLVEDGKLSAGHARAVLTVADKEKQILFANEIIEKGYSVRKAESLAPKFEKAEEKKESQETGTKTEEINYVKEISESLSKKLGRKVKLSEGPKSGKIEIEFYGQEDREFLINQLNKMI